MGELSGKRALITGASRGIGAGIALALAEKGANVAITYDKSSERAEEVVKSIIALGQKGIAIQADSADADAIQRSISTVNETFGGIDILVNNAGIARFGAVADMPVEDIDALLNVNIRSAVLTARAAIPHLGSGGRIIFIGSSLADRIVDENVVVYALTKSAQIALTRGLARELGPRDITVNLVQPGATDTDMNPASGEHAERLRSMTPLGRYGTPADVAAAVAFLVSPSAKQITGATITVDGGLNT